MDWREWVEVAGWLVTWLAMLAGIVAIWTFLSFSLEVELEGCRPWQRAGKDA